MTTEHAATARPKRTRPKPRVDRWNDAAGDARAALDTLRAALEGLREIQEEFEEWNDRLPENLQGSALGEKLEAVCDLNLDPDSLLSDAEEAIGGAEAADLPLGFGRD